MQATGSDGAVAEQRRLAAEQLAERTSSNGASPSGASSNGASAKGATYSGAATRAAQQNGTSATSNGVTRRDMHCRGATVHAGVVRDLRHHACPMHVVRVWC